MAYDVLPVNTTNNQCHSIATATGARCKRRAFPRQMYCWQHLPKNIKVSNIARIFAILLAIATLLGGAAALQQFGVLPSRLISLVPENVPTPVIRVASSGGDCYTYLLPSNLSPKLSPNQDVEKALDLVRQARESKEIFQWPRVLSPSHPDDQSPYFSDQVMIASDPSNKSELILRNNAHMVIYGNHGVPDYVSAAYASGCGGLGGGLGEIRTFSNILLEPTSKPYSGTITSKDAPFFTLQPGESEAFAFGYVCDGPGIYTATVEIAYTAPASQQEGHVTRISPQLICPKSVTSWDSFYDNRFPPQVRGTYLWNGKSYIITPNTK